MIFEIFGRTSNIGFRTSETGYYRADSNLTKQKIDIRKVNEEKMEGKNAKLGHHKETVDVKCTSSFKIIIKNSSNQTKP